MKRFVCILVAVVVCLALVWTFMFFNPIQDLVNVKGAEIEYPHINITPYRFCETPSWMAEDSYDFNMTIFYYVQQLLAQYGDSLTLSYTIACNHDGTVVRFFGTGTNPEGQQEAISKELSFDLVVRSDAYIQWGVQRKMEE